MRNQYKLSAITVKQITKSGRYSDGINNLNLLVKKTGTKSWAFRYTRYGKRKQMGLGAYPAISLKDAREVAATIYKRLKSELTYDPITERQQAIAKAKQEQQAHVNFKWCAEQFILAKTPEWSNPKSATQWTSSLTQYALPIMGDYPVKEINTELVMRVLKPIWATKTETATRIRGRLENILSWAAVQGYRSTDNPALWKGHLENLLAKPSKVKKVTPHKALPYKDIHTLISELCTRKTMSAFALEVLILTATRTNEIIGATWREIDIDNAVWTIPAERMKARKSHNIPLSSRALKIINYLHEARTSDYVFQGGKTGKGLSNAAMDKLLQVTMKYDVTVHGFRSTFRDWTAEETTYPNELCEMALAHTIKNQAEAAYRRGDMLKKRMQLMQDWQQYMEHEPSLANTILIKTAPPAKH